MAAGERVYEDVGMLFGSHIDRPGGNLALWAKYTQFVIRRPSCTNIGAEDTSVFHQRHVKDAKKIPHRIVNMNNATA